MATDSRAEPVPKAGNKRTNSLTNALPAEPRNFKAINPPMDSLAVGGV